MSILVIAAHPDDEVLGCGGSIARFAREGRDVHVAILGEGITSRYTEREKADPQLIEALREDSRSVARRLGVRGLHQYSLPDNRFDSVPLLEVVKLIEELIAEIEPVTVFTQHGGDLNVDHAIVFRATMIATRPMAGCSVREVYAYAVASSTEWAFQHFAPPFRPDTFVDISDTLQAKIDAMQAYESEARPFPHPRSPEALQAAAAYWGSAVGLAAAEPFECVRAIR